MPFIIDLPEVEFYPLPHSLSSISSKIHYSDIELVTVLIFNSSIFNFDNVHSYLSNWLLFYLNPLLSSFMSLNFKGLSLYCSILFFLRKQNFLSLFLIIIILFLLITYFLFVNIILVNIGNCLLLKFLLLLLLSLLLSLKLLLPFPFFIELSIRQPLQHSLVLYCTLTDCDYKSELGSAGSYHFNLYSFKILPKIVL